MSDGEVHAYHYASRKPVRVQWRNGVISAIETSDQAQAGRWIAPALFDVQVNGYVGVDFQQDNLSLEQLSHATRGLRRDGCSQFFFTLITAEWPKLMMRLKRARVLREQSSELRSAVAGWHIEGPFLSEKPGFHGAHNPAWMCDPTAAHIEELREVCGNDPVLLTLAPERRGSLEAIHRAVSLGIIVSLGHTDASAELLREAVTAGATGFTHLGNACPRELDRHDNIIWRVCDTEGLTVSFIADGIHVSPAPFRLMHRLLENRPIVYTTDAMAAAGAPSGRYTLGSVEVEVGDDQIVRQPGKTNFAGSALRPKDGPFRAARMLSRSWQECWARLSEAPARFVGANYSLAVGGPAHLCVVEVNERNELISLSCL